MYPKQYHTIAIVLLFFSIFFPFHLTYANEISMAETQNDSDSDTITRGEAAQAIYQVILQEGKKPIGTDKFPINYLYEDYLWKAERTLENPFEDLKEDDPYYEAIIMLHRLRIYNGIKDGKKIYANTGDVLTREESFVLINNVGNFMGNNPQSRFLFQDAPEISEFAYDAVNNLVDMWLLSGYSDHTIRPKELMKQEDFLNLLNKAIKCPRKPAYQNMDSSIEEYYQSTIKEEHLSKQIEVILKEDVITSLEDNFFFRFNNYSNTRLEYGPEENFTLEIKKGDTWYVVPMNRINHFDEILYLITVGKSDPAKYFEIELKKHFNNLENGHYRMIFRISQYVNAPEFIFYKPYEDILCMEEFDILVENENNDKK